MLGLILFDAARAVRPRADTLRRGHVRGLGRLPGHVHADLGLRGDLLLTRALARAESHLVERRKRDADRLLAILCDLSARRGFGPVEWDHGDV